MSILNYKLVCSTTFPQKIQIQLLYAIKNNKCKTIESQVAIDCAFNMPVSILCIPPVSVQAYDFIKRFIKQFQAGSQIKSDTMP